MGKLPRIAWLFPSLARGDYWHPLLAGIAEHSSAQIVFTGLWPGYAADYEGAFEVHVVGKTRVVRYRTTVSGYPKTIVLPPLQLLPRLFAWKPDVLFVSSFTFWTALGMLYKFAKPVRLVVVYDGSSSAVDDKKGLRWWWRRLLARGPDAFVTNSHGGKRYLTDVLDIPTEKVFAHPYQVPECRAERERDEDPAAPLRFIFVGRVMKGKGLDSLITAAAAIHRSGAPTFEVTVLGDGPEREALEARCAAEGLAEIIRWAGWVPANSVPAYFADADVLIFPSRADVWGVVILEALAAGVPVVCSTEAGAAELIIEGENGWLFDPYKEDQLVSAMKAAQESKNRLPVLRTRAIESVRPFSVEAAVRFISTVALSRSEEAR